MSGIRKRRLVKFGDLFTEDELDRDEAVLEEVVPAKPPGFEPDESWARNNDLPDDHRLRAWVRERIGRHHGDD